MKSVPSPGSPSQHPSLIGSGLSFGPSLRAFILACNCANNPLSGASWFSPMSVASGKKLASGTDTSFVGSASACSPITSCGSACIWSSGSACVFSSGSAAPCSGALSSPSSSFCCSSASCARRSASAAAAASASFSFFDFLPLFLGLAGSSLSWACVSVAVSSASLNKDGCSLDVTLLFFTSKFSPSFPFTEYTLSVSFLTILVLFFFWPKGFFVPSSMACLSSIEYTISSRLSPSYSAPSVFAMSSNSDIFFDNSSSLLYISVYLNAISC